MGKDMKVDVVTQKDMNNNRWLLHQAFYEHTRHLVNNPREMIFKLRFYPWIFMANWIKSTPADFNPFTPSLEMKFALQAARETGARIELGGMEINDSTIRSLMHEKRMDIIPFIWRALIKFHGNRYTHEYSINPCYNTLNYQYQLLFSSFVIFAAKSRFD